jgi:hypothetical protein
MPLTIYSSPEEIAAAKNQVEADRARLAQQAKFQTGNFLILGFWRRHPHIVVNQANEKLIREFIGPREFTAALLDEWFPQFEAQLAKVQQPRETAAYIPPEPKPELLVPFSRRELLHMEASSLRELINRSSDHNNEVNRILNEKEKS